MAYKTYFTIKNKKKYIGDHTNIHCRSLWERRMCKYLDENIKITKWGFEVIKIPYISPSDNKMHNYIPDFIIETYNSDKRQITVLEIKPMKQTIDPNFRKRKNLKECLTYSINRAKWDSAELYCTENGWDFKILTEKELFT